MTLVQMDAATLKRVEEWSKAPFDEETQKQVIQMALKEPVACTNAFYTRLSFGTGGLRGLMGVGTNRINPYTISFATEGLARYLRKTFGGGPLRVFIGYDCRHHSKAFAEEAASVLAGHEINVFLSDTLVTTPFTSFATRELECHAGIMITASHNPKEYNGYKVYWQDGSQILSPHDRGIETEANQISSPSFVKKAPLDSPYIEKVGKQLKERYSKALSSCQLLRETCLKEGQGLNIVYSNLHGTGIVFLPDLMKQWGFSNFHPVPLQEAPDGNFPTVDFPNPEEAPSLDLGVQMMQQIGGDLLIATDPDGDRMRVGVHVRNQIQLLNGNQIACLLLHHILSNQKNIPQNGVVVKTIVTTDLFQKIAKGFGVECVDVLTGFKYIGELIHRYEDGSKTYIFGGEESYGTLCGTSVRDKDGVMASLIIAEAALAAKLEGKTLVDRLDDLYKTHGHYAEGIISISYPESKEGHEEMRYVMNSLRTSPPHLIHRTEVVAMEDYLQRKRFDLKTGSDQLLDLPVSDVLVFHLATGAKLVIRPSGTEPKIKIYGELLGVETDCRALLDSCHNLILKTAHH